MIDHRVLTKPNATDEKCWAFPCKKQQKYQDISICLSSSVWLDGKQIMDEELHTLSPVK